MGFDSRHTRHMIALILMIVVQFLFTTDRYCSKGGCRMNDSTATSIALLMTIVPALIIGIFFLIDKIRENLVEEISK